MLQVIQSYKTGHVKVHDVASPLCRSTSILVRNHASLISIGTERSTIELGRKSLLGKGASRPDLVRRVWDKAKKEGLIKTWQEVLGRLDVPTPLGYSSSGTVVESGISATKFAPGDRVACIGQGFASHAEYIAVPVNMACIIPAAVSYEEAAFGMLGVIALHGIRSANLTFGSRVVVMGLGLLGLLTVQILRAYGCEVVAIDLNLEKTNLAKKFGASIAGNNFNELERMVEVQTQFIGVDAVIITASTSGRGLVDQAIKLSRKKGRIVVVGTADIHPDRNELWQKEVELVVSKAGGPGSLDPLYEIEGIDLPAGDVRWTENRNLQEFLRLLSEGKLDVKPLITHRFVIENAENVYSDLLGNQLIHPIGVILEYPNSLKELGGIGIPLSKANQYSKSTGDGKIQVGFIGAGLFSKALLLPALSKCKNIYLHTLISSTGINSDHVGRKFKFKNQGTNTSEIWNNNEIQAVVCATPHDTHAALVCAAIKNSKAIFIEKPLCISRDELNEIEKTSKFIPSENEGELKDGQISMIERLMIPIIHVGHNRRFSPHLKKIQQWLSSRKSPLSMQMRVNAGFISHEHWVHSDDQGRSRIVGEMSHFVDLFHFITGALIVRVHAERISGDDCSSINNDNIVVGFKFSDGSIGNFLYTASGDKAYSREVFEIFFDGKVICSRDYRVSELHDRGSTAFFKTNSQEMGYKEELDYFIDCVSGNKNSTIKLSDALHTMEIIFAIEKSLSSGLPVSIL